MQNRFFKAAGSIAVIALAVTAAGCSMDMDIGSSDGVPLAELDQSGDAPTELALASGDTVIITTGETLSIDVEGDAEDVAKMRFSLEGGMLGIARESGNWSGGTATTVRVTMPAPTEIDMAGSGNITSDALAAAAEINIAGSGDVEVSGIDSQRLEVSIAGSGGFAGTGETDVLEVALMGSGSANMPALKADNADISIAGSGSANFASDGTVEASIAGSGSVNVTGNASCNLNAMGSGSLNCKPGTSAPSDDGTSADSE